MNITGNTILITGGGSGIGRGLAEALAKEGNHVIIAGRRRQLLDEVTAANPGMKSIELDMQDPASIRALAARMASDFPNLNVVIENAGVMKMENLQEQSETADAESTITTNLLGPIRLTAALLPLLARQPRSTIMTVTSGLAFVPMAATPTYCATKAGLHSYTMSLRWQLKGTTTEVVELMPPYVQTHLTGSRQAEDPRAMPLADFIAEVMQIIRIDPAVTEICVDRVKPMRFAAESGKLDATFQAMNNAMADRWNET